MSASSRGAFGVSWVAFNVSGRAGRPERSGAPAAGCLSKRGQHGDTARRVLYIPIVDETTQAQLKLIRRVVDVLARSDVSAWLFGGWGLDARLGRITRNHSDVEFWVERSDSAGSKAALVDAGSMALSTQPPEEACEFIWDDVAFSTAYFERRADGVSAQPDGRWSDWVFPADSFGTVPGLLDGAAVPAMSVAGMLAMKEQYPTLRNGRPWREKDVGDIAMLRSLLADR